MMPTTKDEHHDDEAPLALPQPCPLEKPYRYVLNDDIDSIFFSSPLDQGTLVWVLKSKGASKSDGRSDLFLRARVVKTMDEDDRVLVRYPKGSEYRVKRCNLIPVLEDYSSIVIIAAETPEYRRASVVHTCVGECFLEIGCDFGPTVDRVQRALTQVGAVPRVAGELEDNDMIPVPCANDGRVYCLGVDKSPESIDIAVSRFPDCTFSVEDALTDDGTVQLRSLCRTKLIGGYPSVVAVDINGNREIPAVLQCIGHVMNPGQDMDLPGEQTWNLPRLIIVKSRLLYHEFKRQKGEEVP